MKFISGLGAGVLVAMGILAGASAQPVKVGAGTYHLSPKSGDKAPPAAPHRTEAMLKLAGDRRLITA